MHQESPIFRLFMTYTPWHIHNAVQSTWLELYSVRLDVKENESEESMDAFNGQKDVNA